MLVMLNLRAGMMSDRRNHTPPRSTPPKMPEQPEVRKLKDSSPKPFKFNSSVGAYGLSVLATGVGIGHSGFDIEWMLAGLVSVVYGLFLFNGE